MSIDSKPEEFCLNSGNSNNEEEEDEKEQLRRQEEIKDLLNAVMGDFNYDESTLNSLNCSVDHIEPSQLNLHEKYKEAGYNDTLKALYEARTRELENLSHKLAELEQAKTITEKEKERKIICLLAEQEQLKISLKESQNLNVTKTEEINKLTERLLELEKQYKELEEKFQKVSEDRDVLHMANNSLHQQLVLLEKGFLPKQNAERGKIEKLENKVEDLCSEVQTLEMDIQRKNRELNDYKQIMERLVQEKDEINKENEDEIARMKLELHKKEMDCVNVAAEVQRLSREKEDLKYTLKRNETTNAHNLLSSMQSKLEEVALERNSLKEQLSKFVTENTDIKFLVEKQNDHLRNYKKLEEEVRTLKAENKMLQKEKFKNNESEEKRPKVNVGVQITEKRQTVDVGLQTSDSTNTENQRIMEKIRKLQEENSFLKVKVSEREEQEALLKDLQRKAQEFERMIHERDAKLSYATASTNTEEDPVESIKLQYETKILRLETHLRENIREEFNRKLLQKEKLINEKVIEMQKSYEMMAEKQIKELQNKLKDERNATIELIEELGRKYLELENEKIDYRNKYLSVQNENVQIKDCLSNLKNEFRKQEAIFQEKYKSEVEAIRQYYEGLASKLVSHKEEKLKKRFYSVVNSLARYNKEIAVLQENIFHASEEDKQ